MTISRFTPPLDYLKAASRASLQSFELTRLNHAANLRNEIAALIDQWIQESSEALLARWLLDHHKSLQSQSISQADLVRSLPDPPSSLLPESIFPMADLLPAPPRFAPSSSTMKGSLARKTQKQRHSATG